MNSSNQELFAEVRELQLPVSEYAITASGPLGIRSIREISDIDLVVSNKLWQQLKEQYPVDESGIKKIVISDNIDAFCEQSFANIRESNDPDVISQIKTAEIIERLPFVSLNVTKYYKKKMSRPKDLKDIELIDSWIIENS